MHAYLHVYMCANMRTRACGRAYVHMHAHMGLLVCLLPVCVLAWVPTACMCAYVALQLFVGKSHLVSEE